MVKFAQHPNSHVKVALDELRPWELHSPRVLQEFLGELNLTETTDQVWELYVQLCEELGQTFVSYAFQRFDSHDKARLVFRSNVSEEWLKITQAIPDFTYFDYGRMHCLSKTTAFVNGIEFLDLYRDYDFCTPEYIAVVEKAAEYGIRSGLWIPLRSSSKVENGGSSFGGAMNRADFTEFMAEHGTTVQIAAMSVNNFYQMHMRSELADQVQLTSRQRDLLRRAANGAAVKEIAADWGVSIQAVNKHLQNIFDRMDTRSKTEIMARAVKMDLISESDFERVQYQQPEWH